MKYIVLDMEWNRPLSKQKQVKEPVVLKGEIIQIGAVKLNEQLEEVDDFNIKVRPMYYTKMNREVENLISVTTSDLQEGRSFKEAIEIFRKWCGKDSVLLTWGPCDIRRLKENHIVNGVEYDWIPETFDAQLMFDFQETMENRQYSLDYAMYYFGLKGIKAHDALNDARDTAAVIRELDVEDFIREEREWRNECCNDQVA